MPLWGDPKTRIGARPGIAEAVFSCNGNHQGFAYGLADLTAIVFSSHTSAASHASHCKPL
jgi:hypothetical protein